MAEAGRIGGQRPLFRAGEPVANNLIERSRVRDLARDEKALADDRTSARRAYRGRNGCFDPRRRDVRGGRGFALGRAAQQRVAGQRARVGDFEMLEKNGPGGELDPVDGAVRPRFDDRHAGRPERSLR